MLNFCCYYKARTNRTADRDLVSLRKKSSEVFVTLKIFTKSDFNLDASAAFFS